MGVLRIPHIYIRGKERGAGAFRQWLQHGEDRPRGGGLLQRYSRLWNGNGDGICGWQECALSALHSKIHSYMATLLHSVKPEHAFSRGKDEAYPKQGDAAGQEGALLRRLHCARHPASRQREGALRSGWSEGMPHAHCLSAARIRMSVHQLHVIEE